MLVLSRRPNQAIHIGDNVVLTVLSVRGDQVRIGIQAPDSVTVLRDELVVSVAEENAAAAATVIDVAGLPRGGR